MSTAEHHPRRGRGRRPADEVRADILAAAGDLLIEGGMAAFTIDKDQLEFPDTGDIEADLRAQLHAFLALVREGRVGPVVAELIGRAQSDPDLKAAYLQGYSAPRRALAVSALNTAKARGQLRADLDLETLVDQLWGACYHRLLVPDQPLDEPFVDALVDNLFRGIAP
jgi:hypothetical protein